jgi:thiol-disulfide isomerase/thioredoxin
MIVRATLTVLLSAIALSAQPAASSVAKLAKDGHWEPKVWEQHAALIGKPAPDLDLSGWLNGELSREGMKGKIVIVDFWATWCGPCIASIPHNNEMAKKYKEKGVVLVGVCGSGRGEEKMADVVRDRKIAYPVAHPTPETTKAWQVAYWPTYAVVDRNGIIRALGIKPDYVDKVVDAILKEEQR